MIYRLKSKLAIHDRLETFVIGVPGTEKKPLPSGPKTYESNFKAVSRATLPCTIFEAPDYEEDLLGISLVMNLGKENEVIPDIWTCRLHIICSEKFKNILQGHDDMPHQFIPINIFNKAYDIIETKQPYYWLNIKRFVSIKGEFATPKELNFFPIPDKENFISEVQNNKKLYDGLSELPLWRYSSGEAIEDRSQGVFTTLYMGGKLKDVCDAAEITGIDLYSVQYGVDEESLAEIHYRGK